jgi:O6-methylguanine-DNA--protein-cysteine methyltransferase
MLGVLLWIGKQNTEYLQHRPEDEAKEQRIAGAVRRIPRGDVCTYAVFPANIIRPIVTNVYTEVWKGIWIS